MELDINNKAKYEALCKQCEGDYLAYLYDCDGTLADNMPAHKEAFARVALGYGVNVDTNIIDELAGWPTVDVIAEINRRYNTDFDAVSFAAQKSQNFYETIDQTKPVAHVMAHLLAAPKHIKIGVVSGGRRETVEKTLAILGISHLVETLVCAGDTEKGKPYPDPFLLAAEKLGVPPQACIVFEDGDAGIQSAIAAGMHSIRIDQL